MESKYFCEICGTTPDQLSHHKAHLQTQKHKNNCQNFITELKIFSLYFREISHKTWYESEHKDFIISKYEEITNNKNNINNEEISNWILSMVLSCGNGRYDWDAKLFNGKSPMEYYQIENNLNEEIKLKDNLSNKNTDYINWGIDKMLKYKETIQYKPSKKSIIKEDNSYRIMLSRQTNVKFNRIKDIRNGLIDLRYLLKPINHIDFSKYDIDVYNDIPLKYSCLLFDEYGIHSYNSMYKGECGPIDTEECPEVKKYNSFYFYKEINIEHISKVDNVLNYGETRIEKRKVWLSCDMGDFINYFDYLEDKTNKCFENDIPTLNYSYISNDDFKYFIKESLIETFTNRIKKIEENINSETELIKRGLMKSIWINNDERIVKNFRDNNYYLINKNLAACNKSDSSNTALYTYNTKTDEEKEVSIDKKLTEEQTSEYKIFLNKKNSTIEKLNEELKYCESELLKIKDLSLSSDIIKSVVHICQYLFEYNEDLIEYYKNNGYIGLLNRQKERMEKAILAEEIELEDIV